MKAMEVSFGAMNPYHFADTDVLTEGKGMMTRTHLGVGVDLETASSRGVEGGDLGHVLILPLTLLLLELERDTRDGAALNALHQVGGEAGDLVAQAF